MILSSMRHGIFSGIFLGILVLGGFGLMLSDWGGFFRNGVTKTDVVVIDGHPIKASEFDHIVRRMLQGQNISTSDAYKAGFIDKILKQEVMTRLLRKAAFDHGITPDDRTVANKLHTLLTPIAGESGDMKQALARVLQAQGLRESELVESIRNDIGTGLLRETIGEGIYVPSAMTKAYYQWNMEERSIKYVSLSEKSIDVGTPDEATLEHFYDSIKAAYSIPETRDVTLGVIDPSVLVKHAAVTDDQVKSFYDKNKDDYALPETRALEQAVLKSEKEASDVLKAAEDSKNLKAAVTKVTGKADAFNKGNFDEKSLPDQISQPAFEAKTGDFVGPVQSPLGWHVIYVSAINEPGYKSFDSVKAQIRDDLTHNGANDELYEITNQIEDRLAEGEKLEDIAGEFKMKTVKLGKIQTGANIAAIDEYGADKDKIQKAIIATKAGESSPLSEISGGKMFTVHVNSIDASHPKDLKDVKAEVVAKWTEVEKRRKLMVRALDITQSLDDKKTTLEKVAKDFGTSIESGKAVRGSAPPSGITKEGVAQIMNANTAKAIAIPGESGMTIVTIDKVELPQKTPTASELSDIEKNLKLDLQEERFVSYINNVEHRYPVKTNHELLDRLYGQVQTDQ